MRGVRPGLRPGMSRTSIAPVSSPQARDLVRHHQLVSLTSVAGLTSLAVGMELRGARASADAMASDAALGAVFEPRSDPQLESRGREAFRPRIVVTAQMD